jgi:hypothetical protein
MLTLAATNCVGAETSLRGLSGRVMLTVPDGGRAYGRGLVFRRVGG